jgi:hypothetical protein
MTGGHVVHHRHRAFVAPGLVDQRRRVDLGQERRSVGTAELLPEVDALARSHLRGPFPDQRQLLGREELEDRDGEELLDRMAHDLGHAPVGVPGAPVAGDPHAPLDGLEDLAVEEGLGFTLGQGPRTHHRDAGDRRRQGQALAEQPDHRLDPLHVGHVVQAVAGGGPRRLQELEPALPRPQRADADPGSPRQLADAHLHPCTVEKPLQEVEGFSACPGRYCFAVAERWSRLRSVPL